MVCPIGWNNTLEHFSFEENPELLAHGNQKKRCDWQVFQLEEGRTARAFPVHPSFSKNPFFCRGKPWSVLHTSFTKKRFKRQVFWQAWKAAQIRLFRDLPIPSF
jgi:hypothetical protein